MPDQPLGPKTLAIDIGGSGLKMLILDAAGNAVTERTRMVILVLCAVLTATAAAAIGIVAFVGLVAPHAARAVVGARHARVIPVSVLLGAVMVGYADVLGRSVIAPHEIPTGLVTALIGTPYFVWLLWRSRTV